jgi:hypothetical protein
MASDAQSVANKRNAQLSTGPKNAQKTKFNALKHGLTAEETVLDDSPFYESKRQFKTLIDQFMQDLAPRNAAEAFLIQQMAQACWRLRRATKAENAIFRERDRELVGAIVSKHTDGSALSEEPLDMMSSLRINNMVEDAKADLENLEKNDLDVSTYLERKEFANLEGASLKEKVREDLKLKIKFFEIILQLREKNALDEYEQRADEACIPPEIGLETVLRYRSSIQREFYTAFRELMHMRGAPAVDVHLD